MARKGNLSDCERKSGIKYKKSKLSHYIIYTNTEQTEKNYFNGLVAHYNRFNDKLNIKSVKQSRKLINNILDEKRKNSVLNKLWIVIDRDEENDFDEMIKQAESKNINVAWSNPCIEVWFAAYFSDMPNTNSSKNCCDEFSKIFSLKTGQRYEKKDPDIYEKLIKFGNEENAVRRAKGKLVNFDRTSKVSEFYPATTVHILVKELTDILKQI